MKSQKGSKTEKPSMESIKHLVDPEKDQDIVLKAGGFRLYLKNRYMIVALINDILTGVLYLSGSLVQTFTDLERLGMYLYIFASFFLLMRPILIIIRHLSIYNKKEYEEQVLGEAEENFNPGEELKKEDDKTKKRIKYEESDK